MRISRTGSAARLQRCAVNVKGIVASLLLAAGSPASSHAEQKAIELVQGGYSVTPLREPLFDESQLVVETTAINNWLGENFQRLTYEQMKGPREHLYYLIDSRVKQLYAAENRVLPAKNDRILETLFSWSESLGVFGGAYVFNAVKAPSSAAKTARMKLPEGIDLHLTNDVFTLRSNFGWSIMFPYHFMIWNVGDFTAKDGPRTQLVALSTGAAKDESQAGRSQATLVFMFSPEKHETFVRYWRAKMGIGANIKPAALGVKNLESRFVVDEATKMHKEFTSWSDATGSFGVAYIGIEGTYEWNRPHFIDFLRFTKTKDGSRPK